MTIEHNELPRYRISIHHDGHQYVAEVPDLKGCVGHGWSYAAALASVEKAIHDRSKTARERVGPEPVTSRHLIFRDSVNQYVGPQAIVGELVQKKFGNLSVESLCSQIGGECSTAEFLSALNGSGTREIRIQIALALGVVPSKLWSGRAFTVKMRDDEVFQEQRRLLGITWEEVKALDAA